MMPDDTDTPAPVMNSTNAPDWIDFASRLMLKYASLLIVGGDATTSFSSLVAGASATAVVVVVVAVAAAGCVGVATDTLEPPPAEFESEAERAAALEPGSRSSDGAGPPHAVRCKHEPSHCSSGTSDGSDAAAENDGLRWRRGSVTADSDDAELFDDVSLRCPGAQADRVLDDCPRSLPAGDAPIGSTSTRAVLCGGGCGGCGTTGAAVGGGVVAVAFFAFDAAFLLLLLLLLLLRESERLLLRSGTLMCNSQSPTRLPWCAIIRCCRATQQRNLLGGGVTPSQQKPRQWVFFPVRRRSTPPNTNTSNTRTPAPALPQTTGHHQRTSHTHHASRSPCAPAWQHPPVQGTARQHRLDCFSLVAFVCTCERCVACVAADE